MRRWLPLFICLLSLLASAQTKNIVAVKTTEPITIDGNLDDAAWKNAPVVSDFIQNFPNNGAPSSSHTEVRILYDNNAIYIGAHLFDDPALIRKQLTSRDAEGQQDVDFFSVFFDTYNDQQNGFQFLVTSANVQTDARLSNSDNTRSGDYGDKTWDAVWQSKTSIQSDGWVVEMRIPYISLRFPKSDMQTWGLQFLRSIRRINETSFWNRVDPNVSGFVNQFGKLTNLENILPPLRLSFSPYLSGGLRYNPEGTGKREEHFGSGGMDVKYGINESFTLDATLVPDFGQVVSDNVINNLSPFELRFQENRPFFTEGTELFNKAGLFYSRRIGATPTGYGSVQRLYGTSTNYEIVRNPSLTRLYNAIKLSGRTKNNLGIGIFNAITAPMHAEIRDLNTKNDTLIQTEPLTNYNIIVIDKPFAGRSFVTFTNTNVIRNGAARDANVSALDWGIYDKTNIYGITGGVHYNTIFGNTPYNSSYFLRTDTITINGRRYLKPYDGFSARLRLGKVGGKIQYFTSALIESDKYDRNDLGFLPAPNEITYQAGASYNQFQQTKNFVTYSYRLNLRLNQLYKPNNFSEAEITASAFWWFRNFWDVNLTFGIQPTWSVNYFELQKFGYRLRKPAFRYLNVSGSSDSRKRLFVNYEFAVSDASLKDDFGYLSLMGARYRFSDKFSLSLTALRQHETLQVGYAFSNEPNGAPRVGYRGNKEYTTILSGNYNFTPRMNLTLRARHYWNQLNYQSFYNVDERGYHIPRSFIPDQDENFNIFNLDAFFTWDFRLGSRLIFGWKNWLGDQYGVEGLTNTNYFRNIGKTLELEHGNELTLRFIYFIDYNQLRRKK